MFDVRVNSFENHLLIILQGKFELAEANQASEKIIKAIKSLVPGFTVITDIRELAPATEDVRQVFLNTMQAMKNSGMGLEVRVVNQQNLVTANQFQRTSRAAGYSAQEVNSVPEAQRLIDQLVTA
ncbi:MAG: hypothetical protein GYA34_07155 [Chloroflexi bacterium]|nr:hypothetical protein [Chloroflexota bacterium]